jgi:hypothetical protein
MAEPGPGDVHVDAALTDVSVANFQAPGNFVWRQFAPIIGSPSRSNRYYVFAREDLLRSEAIARAPGAEAPVRTYGLSDSPFDCQPLAVALDVDRQTRANADPALDPEQDAAAVGAQDLNIALERALASAYFGASAWGTTATGGTDYPVSGTAKWSDAASSPIEDIASASYTILSNTGFLPNTLLLGAQSWYSGLMHHPDIIGRLPDNAPKMATEAFLAQLLGLDRVLISRAAYNSAAEGATASYAMALTDGAVLAYVAPNPGLRTPSAAYAFSWRGAYPGDVVTRRIEIPEKDGTVRVETEAAIDFVVVASELGYEFTDTV